MTLRKCILAAGVVAAFSAGAVGAAELTIYKQPNFNGERLTLRDDNNNLSNRGFTDQASSLVIRSGRWELCTQPNFAGDCVTLGRGEYASLDPKLNHRIESARDLTNVARNQPNRPDYGARNERSYGSDRGYAYGERDDRHEASVVIYNYPGFHGNRMRLDRNTASLEGTAFDNHVASLVVNDGTWQACSDPGFQGICRTYEPGRYADLGRFNSQIGSLRRIG